MMEILYKDHSEHCPPSFFKNLVNYLYFSMFEKEKDILHCPVLQAQENKKYTFLKKLRCKKPENSFNNLCTITQQHLLIGYCE